MNNTYFTSLSGMLAASYGLQNTSNNVSNMQSPGFKRNDVFYSSLGNDHFGAGVGIGGNTINFSEGHYLETGDPSHLAIVGQGFFIVRLSHGELLYTRDGEFGFNNEGMLIDRHSHGLVQGYDQSGQLVPICKDGRKTCGGKATHYADLKGQLIIEKYDLNKPGDQIDSRAPDEGDYKPQIFNFDKIYDEQGKSHRITVELQNKKSPFSSGDDWEVKQITCDDASIQFNPQDLKFLNTVNGAPDSNYNTIQLRLNGTQPITLKLGDHTNDESHSVYIHEKGSDANSSSVDILKQDGYGEGQQINVKFDDNGLISYIYDNGQSLGGVHVALARFDDLEHTLVQAGDNLFRAKNETTCHIGRANQHGFGAIQPQKIESSDVDSTTEFANIVVLQRMFQACSQIMDIDKQLLEELNRK